MKLIDLFPPCQTDRCPDKRQGDHKHILPYQKEFLTASQKYLGLVGGYGSGKTLPACVLCVLLCLAVPGNRGIIVRRSYSKLHDSTLRILLEVLQRADVGFEAREMRDGWPHRLILENGSEIIIRETKDLGRFLGPEYGFFYIDEAVEEPEKTFNDLVGRLRLARARKYLKGIITTNPPNSPPYAPHWIEQKFGSQQGIKVHEVPDGKGGTSQMTFRLWRVSTRVNPFLPEEYVRDLMATHSPQEVRRIIEGEYGFSFEGKAVYSPPFDAGKHVGEPQAYDSVSLVRGWDFSYRCPAVTWHQFIVCKFGKCHWHILYDYVPQNIETEALTKDVLRYTREWFPEHAKYPGMIVDVGDTAGAQFNERGPGPIIRLARPPFGLSFRHKKFPDVDPGLDLVREIMREPQCKCGHERFLVHRRCRPTIDGLAGGYHYPKDVPGKMLKDKPVKDGYYDNVMDSIRYVGELIYRPANRDPNFWRELMQDERVPHEYGESSFDWMRP